MKWNDKITKFKVVEYYKTKDLFVGSFIALSMFPIGFHLSIVGLKYSVYFLAGMFYVWLVLVGLIIFNKTLKKGKVKDGMSITISSLDEIKSYEIDINP